MNTFRILVLVIFLFSWSACSPLPHCTYSYKYQGIVLTNDSFLKEGLQIRLSNVGDVLFRIDNVYDGNSSVANDGSYSAKGSFYTLCDVDISSFDEKDSISFEILKRDSILMSGKFSFQGLEKEYDAQNYLFTFKLPAISVN